MAQEGLGPDNAVCKTAYIAPVRAQVLADKAAAEAAGDTEKADMLAKTAANLDLPEYQKNMEPLAEAVYRILTTHAKTTSDSAIDIQFWQWMAEVNVWLLAVSNWQQGVANVFNNWVTATAAELALKNAIKALASPGPPPVPVPTGLKGRIE